MLRSVKYGLHAAVVAGLVTVPIALHSSERSVELAVDGHVTTVQTDASTVSQLLATQGYKVSSHDLLAPSGSTKLRDGSRVVLEHGHLLRLNVDGTSREVWTTSPTVSGALTALGYTSRDFVSVSRDQRLPLAPSAFTIRTPQFVTVIHDGQSQPVMTTDATVASLLTDLGVSVGPNDRLSTLMTAPITPGETIRLQRVVKKSQTSTVDVAFGTVKQKDADLDSGATKVVRAGKKGQARVTYTLIYVDGKLAGKVKTASVTTAKSRSQILAVGTRKVEVPSNTPNQPAPDPGSAKAIAKSLLAERGWGDDQYDCLVTMWNHESGWRTNAANPSGAYGIPQALPGSKMASAGPDWQTNATTQIKWGIGYIAARYNTPCGAWTFWQAHNYY